MRNAILESYLTVAKLASVVKKTPRRIRQLIEEKKIRAVPINARLKRPFYMIPAKEAKRYIDLEKTRKQR